jgi:hypothetical protein
MCHQTSDHPDTTYLPVNCCTKLHPPDSTSKHFITSSRNTTPTGISILQRLTTKTRQSSPQYLRLCNHGQRVNSCSKAPRCATQSKEPTAQTISEAWTVTSAELRPACREEKVQVGTVATWSPGDSRERQPDSNQRTWPAVRPLIRKDGRSNHSVPLLGGYEVAQRMSAGVELSWKVNT